MPVYPSEYCPKTNAANNEKKTVNEFKESLFLGGGKPCHKHLQALTSERSFMADQPAGWT